MRIDVVTIFPEMFGPVLGAGVVGRGVRRALIELRTHDLREYAAGRHRQVDDAPFGGGAGMVMMPEPIFAAVAAIRAANPGPVILMEPWGEPLSQRLVRKLSLEPGLVIVCGRYEGVDDRVREALAGREVSVGDFTVSGGELPAMLLIDAVARLVPGVVGDEASLAQDAAAAGEPGGWPQYTRPAEWRGLRVPEVLTSGDHAAVARWRRERSRPRTPLYR